MTPNYLTSVLSDIEAISTALDNNSLITKTRQAVLTGIKSFQTTPAEKAKLYANFEMQFSIQTVNKIIDVVVNSGLVEQQIEVEKAKALLYAEQKNTQIKEALRIAEETKKLTSEIALLGSNKILVDKQSLTEDKRRLDVMAGINIKNEQALATRQSALFEEARKYILIASTLYNNQIQKSKEENATLSALALDGQFTITDAHLQRVKDALDGIEVTDVSYLSDISGEVGQVNVGT